MYDPMSRYRYLTNVLVPFPILSRNLSRPLGLSSFEAFPGCSPDSRGLFGSRTPVVLRIAFAAPSFWNYHHWIALRLLRGDFQHYCRLQHFATAPEFLPSEPNSIRSSGRNFFLRLFFSSRPDRHLLWHGVIRPYAVLSNWPILRLVPCRPCWLGFASMSPAITTPFGEENFDSYRASHCWEVTITHRLTSGISPNRHLVTTVLHPFGSFPCSHHT